MKLPFAIFCVFFCLLSVSKTAGQEDISREDLLGKVSPRRDIRFSSFGRHYLRKEAMQAFLAMRGEAEKAGIALSIESATRTFSDQKRIWEDKWHSRRPVNSDTGEFLPKPGTRRDNLTSKGRALRILEFTAMPGASRHHWGTDLDLNNVNPSYWEKPIGIKAYNWLRLNAGRFGFCQPYTAGRRGGYFEEKWHWSYLPLAQHFLSAYPASFSDRGIAGLGFAGSAAAIELGIVGNYVLGVEAGCR